MDLLSNYIEKIKNASRNIITVLPDVISQLNTYCTPIHWHVDNNKKGDFIYTDIYVKNARKTLIILQILDELQTKSDHHTDFKLNNFSNIHIILCTHEPKYGVSAMDIEFAKALALLLKNSNYFDAL